MSPAKFEDPFEGRFADVDSEKNANARSNELAASVGQPNKSDKSNAGE